MMTHPTEAQLNDYVDGTLDERTYPVVDEHVRGCESCSADVAGLRGLIAGAASLPRTLQAPDRLWQAVREETIDVRLIRSRLLWELRAPLAAAALLLVISASAVTWWLGRDRGTTVAARSPVAAAAVPALAQAEADYIEAARRLLLVLEARRDRMDPVITRTVEQNLRVTDAAIAEARAALEADPQNQSVAAILNAIYQARIRMLKNAVHLTGET